MGERIAKTGWGKSVTIISNGEKRTYTHCTGGFERAHNTEVIDEGDSYRVVTREARFFLPDKKTVEIYPKEGTIIRENR